MDALVLVAIDSLATRENSLSVFMIFTIHWKNGQLAENKAKSKFANHLRSSMNLSAVGGILGESFF